MKGRSGSALLLLLVALVLLRPWEATPWGGGDGGGAPATARGTVVRVVDGDTLEVRLDGEREAEDVRLIGVDTPETVKPDTPVQCFGPRASAFTHRVATGRRVRLRTGVEQRDVYGRLLAYVWLMPGGADDGGGGSRGGGDRAGSRGGGVSDNPGRAAQDELFLNAELLRRGLARTLTIPPNDRFAERFAGLQRRAARAGRGLWGHCPV